MVQWLVQRLVQWVPDGSQMRPRWVPLGSHGFPKLQYLIERVAPGPLGRPLGRRPLGRPLGPPPLGPRGPRVEFSILAPSTL